MSNVNSSNAAQPSTSVNPAANTTPAVSKPTDTSKQPISPAVPAKTSAATPEETFDVQIDGQVQKKTRKEIIEAYQLRQLSDKKRSEADKVLAEYKRVQEIAQQDPVKFLKLLGHDFEGMATRYLAQKAEDAMKDPKQLEAEKTQAELAQYKQWVAEQKAAQEQQKKQNEIAASRQALHKEIIEAIEEKKELGLPVDEHLIIQIAQEMMVQDKAKKPLNAKEALPAAYAKTQKWLQGMASKMEGEAIVKWLGEDVAKKIRKYDLQQLKSKRTTAQPQSSVKPQSSKEAPKAKPYKTWSEFKADTLDKIK
jgi:hypothetical protein